MKDIGKEVERIRELYIEAMMEGVVVLEDFLKRLNSGEYGNFTSRSILIFLDRVKGEMIDNMYVKLEEKPEWRGDLERRIDELETWIEKLKSIYGREDEKA